MTGPLISSSSSVTPSTATIWLGPICTWSPEGLAAYSGHLAVLDGKIISVGTSKNIENITKSLSLIKYVISELTPGQFIIPGFIDCHLHAPQFPNIGFGLDKPLLEWLTTYTLPLEKQYEEISFATKIYDIVVNRTLKQGTTTACYFGSLHLESSIVLAAAAEDQGQRALIGKVSMNVPNDANYYNSTEKELTETESFITLVKDMKNDLVEPIITPRYALSCDESILKKLGQLAKKYNCKIQSHISESIEEVKLVKKNFPSRKNYTDVYNNADLLTDKCILAHGIYLTDEEIDILVNKNVSIAHCPASNTRLLSGLCPVKKLINKGVTVGLGTDVSGGDSSSILDTMRRCMDVSTHLCLVDSEYANKYSPIFWEESFYLATLGGAKALSLDHKVGSFEVGKEFDALVIDNFTKNSPIDRYSMLEDFPAFPKTENDNIKCMLQQFIYLGDDRNISRVFVKGREILST